MRYPAAHIVNKESRETAANIATIITVLVEKWLSKNSKKRKERLNYNTI